MTDIEPWIPTGSPGSALGGAGGHGAHFAEVAEGSLEADVAADALLAGVEVEGFVVLGRVEGCRRGD